MSNFYQDHKPPTKIWKRLKNSGIFVASIAFHIFLLYLAYLMVSSVSTKQEDVIVQTEFKEAEEVEVVAPPKEKKIELIKEEAFASEDLLKTTETENIKKFELEEIVNDISHVSSIVPSSELMIQNETMPNIGTALTTNFNFNNPRGNAFHYRNGQNIKKALLKHGGSKETQEAVDSALEWLKRQQNKDGFWASPHNTVINGSSEITYALTGFSTLAFLAAGHSTMNGQYQETVKKSLDWLIKNQNSNGSYGNSYIYDSAIIAIVLCEAYAMDKDSTIKKAATKSIEYLSNLSKDRAIHFGSYNNIPKSMSVLGFVLMALKSATFADIPVKESLMKKYEVAMKSFTSFDANGYPLNINYAARGNNKIYKQEEVVIRPVTTSIGALMYIYLGKRRSFVSSLIKPILTIQKNWDDLDLYFTYYTTLALFQYGGEEWKEWNSYLIKTLMPHQQKEGPKDGSNEDFHGSWPTNKYCKIYGRVYSTSLMALCLSSYYRYTPTCNLNVAILFE